jgi:hypothetical protein
MFDTFFFVGTFIHFVRFYSPISIGLHTDTDTDTIMTEVVRKVSWMWIILLIQVDQMSLTRESTDKSWSFVNVYYECWPDVSTVVRSTKYL